MPQFQSFDDEMFVVLPQPLQDLFDRMSALDGSLPILSFLDSNPDTLVTIEDMAYFVSQPIAAIHRVLHALAGLGLARRADVAGLSLFGLTPDCKRQAMVRHLFIWLNRRSAHGRSVQAKMDEQATPPSTRLDLYSDTSDVSQSEA